MLPPEPEEAGTPKSPTIIIYNARIFTVRNNQIFRNNSAITTVLTTGLITIAHHWVTITPIYRHKFVLTNNLVIHTSQHYIIKESLTFIRHEHSKVLLNRVPARKRYTQFTNQVPSLIVIQYMLLFGL